MVTGLPMVSYRDGVCSGCVFGKHHWDSFEKLASWHTSAPLQLVHNDLCGPLPIVSFSGYKYLLTFIDDFSRHTWVYFLKVKSEVFNMVLTFKAFVEKQYGHRILKLRSDNDKEYVNNKFINFCIEHGIQMQHIVPYTPQQNGVAKRTNHTLNEMANYDDSEDDNPPSPSQDPSSTPQLPKWVCVTWDAAGALVGDPTDQQRTHSQFDRASSLMAQASANYDPDTFAEASGHPDWDATMNEQYHSLLANDTWDIVPLPKGRNLVRCKWVYITKFGPDGK
eukprot:PITA_17373